MGSIAPINLPLTSFLCEVVRADVVLWEPPCLRPLSPEDVCLLLFSMRSDNVHLRFSDVFGIDLTVALVSEPKRVLGVGGEEVSANFVI